MFVVCDEEKFNHREHKDLHGGHKEGEMERRSDE